MIIHTASEGVTLAKKLEGDSAGFYEELARLYTKDAEVFQSLARENKKNSVQIDRVYYGVITDAIEGGYAFNLEADAYALNTKIKQGAGYADVLSQAVKLEETIIKFYTEAAAQSQSLMADVPRAFSLIARKRAERKQKLESLRGE